MLFDVILWESISVVFWVFFRIDVCFFILEVLKYGWIIGFSEFKFIVVIYGKV